MKKKFLNLHFNQTKLKIWQNKRIKKVTHFKFFSLASETNIMEIKEY